MLPLLSTHVCTPGRRSRDRIHSATLSIRANSPAPAPSQPSGWITEPVSPASNLSDLLPLAVILQCFLFPSPSPLQTERLWSGSSKLNPTHSWPGPATSDPTPHHGQVELSSYHQLEESFMSSLTEYITPVPGTLAVES